MGLIKALTNAASTALGDQFKEFVNLPQVGSDVLIVRGVVQHGEGNTNPSEGVISNGSKIVIPQGWAMMLVDNGKVEFSSEPGEYTYDNGSEPSIFYGGLGKGILDTFKTIGNRFTFGGQTAKDQRVYYINLLDVTGNKFGSTSPKDVFDYYYNMSIEITFRGTFTYAIGNPLALVQTVIGANPKDRVTFEEVFGDKFKSDVNANMHKAITDVLKEKQIMHSLLGSENEALGEKATQELAAKWAKYGVVIKDVALEDIGATEESKAKFEAAESKAFEIRNTGKAEADKVKAMADAYSSDMQGAMAAATGEALKGAASNENGSMMGFAGFNLANQAGNTVLGAVSGAEGKKGEAKEGAQGGNFCPNCGAPTTGSNFCPNCGAKLN
jgi:membrane protease subunit (stomatin/prohibitin family)